MSNPLDIKVGNFRGKCSALECRIQELAKQVEELEADNAKLHYRHEVLSQLCFCTQRLSDILAVNGPRLEGPLHAGLCSATKSVVDQVSRDLEQLLGWSSLPPSLLPPPVHSSIGLEKDAVKSCVMSGSCLAVLEYALASIHAAPEQFACWVSATTQQAGTREALWREQLASMLVKNSNTPAAAAAGDVGTQAPGAASREAPGAASANSGTALPAPATMLPLVSSSSYSWAAGATGDRVLQATLDYVCALVMALVFSPGSQAERYGRSPLQNPSEAYWRQQTLALGLSQQQVEGVVAAMEIHMQLQAQSIQRQEQLMCQLEACLPPMPPPAAAPRVSTAGDAAAAAAAAAGGGGGAGRGAQAAAADAAGVPVAAAATGGGACSSVPGATAMPGAHSLPRVSEYRPASTLAGRKGELAARAAAALDEPTPAGTPCPVSSSEHSTMTRTSERASHDPAAAAGAAAATAHLASLAAGCHPLPGVRGSSPAALMDGSAYDVIKGLLRQLEACSRKHAWLCVVCACHLIGCLTLRQLATFVLNTAPYPVPLPSWAAWLVGTVAREGPAGLAAVAAPVGAAVQQVPAAAPAAAAAAGQAGFLGPTLPAVGGQVGGCAPSNAPWLTRSTAAAAAPAGMAPGGGLTAAGPAAGPPPAAAAAAGMGLGVEAEQGLLEQLVDDLLSVLGPQQAAAGGIQAAAGGLSTHSILPAAAAAAGSGHVFVGTAWPPSTSCSQLPSPGRLQLLAQAFPVNLDNQAASGVSPNA